MNNINHYCVICGTGYHACDTCNESKKINLWEKFTDTSNHYRIFLILRDHFNKIIDDKQAYEMLVKCDLKGYENFNKNISSHIKKILCINEELSETEKKEIDTNKSNKRKTKLVKNK